MFDTAQEQVIERAKRPEFSGHLEHPTLVEDGANQFCGDEIHFELKVDDGIVTEILHSVRGCTISAAAADLLAARLTGKPFSIIDTLSPQEIVSELGIPLSPTRQKCALLPLETLKQAQIKS